jgi:hypothetical protein
VQLNRIDNVKNNDMQTPNPYTKEIKSRSNPARKAVLLTAIVITILSNTPPAQFFLLGNYSYQNRDRSFTYSEEPGKGMDLEAGMIHFQGWKAQNLNNPNTTLYRTFTIKPWQFWEWWQYIAHSERYRMPYHSPIT